MSFLYRLHRLRRCRLYVFSVPSTSVAALPPLCLLCTVYIGCGFAASMSSLYRLHRLRLCRLPCGKPLAFREAHDSFGGYAARGGAYTFLSVFRKASGFP
jgi:hypothetical protein